MSRSKPRRPPAAPTWKKRATNKLERTTSHQQMRRVNDSVARETSDRVETTQLEAEFDRRKKR